MKLVKLLLLSVIFVLSGCEATFIEKSIPEPKQISMEQYKDKPNAYIQVKWIKGNPNKFMTADPRWDQGLKNTVSYLINRAKLFNYYTFDENQTESDAVIFDRDKTDQAYHNKKEIDYNIELVVYNNYNKEETDWIPVIQVFSLGLIPVSSYQEFIVTMKVYDNQDKLIKSGQNNIIAKNWSGWWFLPMGFKHSHSEFTKLISRQIDTLLKECVEEKVFKYQ